MIPYSLIPATPHDKDTLYQIHRTAMIDIVTQVWGWDESVQIRMFDGYFGLSQLQMVRMGDVIVDYVDLVTESDHDFVANIILHPEVQGQGVGTAITCSAATPGIADQHPSPQALRATWICGNRQYRYPFKYGVPWITGGIYGVFAPFDHAWLIH